MIPARQGKVIVKRYKKYFIDLFGFNEWDIEVYSVSSKSQKYLDLGVPPEKDICGFSIYEPKKKTATIILCYDRAIDAREFLSTMIHEFLHVFISKHFKFRSNTKKTRKFMKNYQQRFRKHEESCILELEEILVKFFWSP